MITMQAADFGDIDWDKTMAWGLGGLGDWSLQLAAE